MKPVIIIATSKSWNIANAKVFRQQWRDRYRTLIVDKKEKLTPQLLEHLKPEYIFFPHWSWIIPQSIFDVYTCVVFHMTDLPFGRGGSPLQNLISRKVYRTKISALKVEQGLDTGPIYLKKPLLIKTGNATEILQRVSQIVFSQMIPYILKHNPIPKPQNGTVTSFPRRQPTASNMLNAHLKTATDVFDFVRMLDGEGYPAAFIPLNSNLKIELRTIKKTGRKVTGTFTLNYEK